MLESFRRSAMKTIKVSPAMPGARQLNLLFDAKCLAGLSSLDRSKARMALAQILMQAAGLSVEELDDDEH
jgi:hypothetical protein